MLKITRSYLYPNSFISSEKRCILNEKENSILGDFLKQVSKNIKEKLYLYYKCLGPSGDYAIEKFNYIIGDPKSYIKVDNLGRRIVSPSRHFTDLSCIKNNISQKYYNNKLLIAFCNKELEEFLINEPLDELFRTFCESTIRSHQLIFQDEEDSLVVRIEGGYQTYGMVAIISEDNIEIINSKKFKEVSVSRLPWIDFRELDRKYNDDEPILLYQKIYGIPVSGISVFEAIENHRNKILDHFSYGEPVYHYY